MLKQMKQISPLDSVFLYIEGENRYTHGTFVWVYDPSTAEGDIDFGDIERHVESRLDVCDLFRKKLKRYPLDVDYPYWVDDKQFDIERHVIHSPMSGEVDWQQFCRKVAHIHNHPLSLEHPPWELHYVDGLGGVEGFPNGAFALLLKLHHVGFDATYAMQVTYGLHDDLPISAPKVSRPPLPNDEADEVGLFGLARQSVKNLTSQPMKIVKGVSSMAPKLGLNKSEGSSKQASKVPETLFNKRLSRGRVFDYRTYPIDDIKSIRKLIDGVTVNDIVIAVVSGGIRNYLKSRHALPNESLITSCPVNIRGKDEVGSGNKIAAIITPMHTEIADPVERLRAINRDMQAGKEGLMEKGTDPISDIANMIPSLGVAAGGYAMDALLKYYSGPPLINFPISNVPGPAKPQYFAGAHLKQITCAGFLMDGFGLFFTAISCDGRLAISMTSATNVVPIPEELMACITESYEELLEETQRVTSNDIGVSTKVSARKVKAKTKKLSTKKVSAKKTSSKRKR